MLLQWILDLMELHLKVPKYIVDNCSQELSENCKLSQKSWLVVGSLIGLIIRWNNIFIYFLNYYYFLKFTHFYFEMFFRSPEVQQNTVDLSLDTSFSLTYMCLSPGGETETSKLEPSDCCSVVSQYSVALFVASLYRESHEVSNSLIKCDATSGH